MFWPGADARMRPTTHSLCCPTPTPPPAHPQSFRIQKTPTTLPRLVHHVSAVVDSSMRTTYCRHAQGWAEPSKRVIWDSHRKEGLKPACNFFMGQTCVRSSGPPEADAASMASQRTFRSPVPSLWAAHISSMRAASVVRCGRIACMESFSKNSLKQRSEMCNCVRTMCQNNVRFLTDAILAQLVGTLLKCM